MTAEFYLLNSSFDHINPNIQDFEDSIMILSEDIENIKKNGDGIFRHSDIYKCLVSPKLTLDEYLYNNVVSENSARKYLRKIIDKAKQTSWSNVEIKELIKSQELEDICKENKLYGFIAFGEAYQFSSMNYTISNLNNWYEFHRYFIKKYPCDPENFVRTCEKVFPRVIFHERVLTEISNTLGGWLNFSNQYVISLSNLNDHFPKYLKPRTNYNRIETLRRFGSECNMDVTPEGNASHKINMTFEFKSENVVKKYCCEPHIKISKSDVEGDSNFYYNRIYFYEGDEEFEDGKILVGHIGKHIDFD